MFSVAEIGKNAGVVWQELHRAVNPQSYDHLKSATGLGDVELAAAIGWLAREDKLSIYEENGRLLLGLSPMNYYI